MAGDTCPQTPPVNKEVVIAVQGGGIYALPMLGQARAFLNAGYVPVGFAGNSGGAILATLLWSGLNPKRIEAALTDLLRNNSRALVDLLLPRGESPLSPSVAIDRLRTVPARLRELFPLPERGLRDFFKILGLFQKAVSLQKDLTAPWNARGAFSGERFEDFVDGLVKEGLGFSETQMVRFRDVPASRPPLLLTVTNVSHGRLEVIDSTDPAFAEVEIARAVRASGGFPGFFQPMDLPGMREGRCFADGGMVANFPLWVFSATFRDRLQQSRRFGWLAARPWIPVGLRVRDNAVDAADTESPSAYAARLALIATGMARNDLEERLVAVTSPSHISVEQPVSSLPLNPDTGKPLGFLDVGAVTTANLAEIIASGEAEANKVIIQQDNRQVYKADCGQKVLTCLKELLGKCEHAMGANADKLKLRANVFIPVQSRMQMRFGVRMEGCLDDGLTFDTLDQGLTGLCYQSRSGAICNLEQVRSIVERASSDNPPYRMNRRLHSNIDPGRTWLVSFPVFDPAERRPLRVAPRGSVTGYTPAMRRLATEHTGPILGVLNIDAGWDYDMIGLDPSPDMHVTDRRIAAVVDVIAQTSLSLSRILVGMEAMSP
jgi:predicted acylesterase/phospholipase RssA